MIKITVELYPHGDESKAEDLGHMFIINNGEASTEGASSPLGSYAIRIFKGAKYSSKRDLWKKGGVSNFPRLKLGPWDLIYRALREIVGSRNESAARESA